MREDFHLQKNSLKNRIAFRTDNNYIARSNREDIQLSTNRIKDREEQVEDIDIG